MRTLVFILAIVSLLIVPSLTDAQSGKYLNDKSLILYFPFDEGEGDIAEDASVYGNNGELDAPEWVEGKFGMALEFDGQSDVVIVKTKDSDELQMAKSPGTVEVWFMVKGQGNSIYPRVLSKESTTGHLGGYTLRLRQYAKLQFELCVEDAQVTGDIPAAELDFNVWYHGVGTWKVGEYKAYLNGEVVKDQVFIGGGALEENPEKLPNEDRTNDLRIGGSFAGPRNFEGIIDEVRIWNRALPQDEIKENMKHGWEYFMGVSPAGRLTTTWGEIKARF